MIVGYKPYNSDIRTRRERDAMCIHVLYAFPTILYIPCTIYKHSKHEPKSFSSFFCLKLRLHSFTHKQYEKCNIIIYERERAKKGNKATVWLKDTLFCIWKFYIADPLTSA